MEHILLRAARRYSRFSYMSKALAAVWFAAFPTALTAQETPESQMEPLDRGLIVVVTPSGDGRLVSWRFFGTDDEETYFEVLRDGKTIKGSITDATCYLDEAGHSSSTYQIVTHYPDETTDTTEEVTPWSDVYCSIPIDKPADNEVKGTAYSYTPNECSVGDVDADGQYEIILKWDPDNSKDNSKSGYTGEVIIDCYELDGTKLWRINLGPNIRAGAHYTQFLVYDFDGDGKAEMICKTAPGSIDGQGNYVNQASTDDEITSADNTEDYRNANGRINGGQEYLTVFNGETGAAIHTVFYNPNRNGGVGGDDAGTFNWGGSGKSDTGSYGNRGERYLATVAYLDGPDSNPSAVMCRGYYTYAFLWAVDFDGSQLTTKWRHYSKSDTEVELTDATGNITTTTYSTCTGDVPDGSCTAYGNGNHNLSCADVDGDGCDEIIYGSCAIDNDGSLLYATGYGHGDDMHLSDLIPDRDGLEVFEVHEEGGDGYHGWDLHDAATGEILHNGIIDEDNGRGLSADIDEDNRGFEFWSSSDTQIRSAETGEVINTNSVSIVFRTYWDGDLYDELYNSTTMEKWNGNGTDRIYPRDGDNFYDIGNSSGNSNKPCLQADILGDWREELILWNDADSAHLNIFSANEETEFRVPTLMHDHVYRLGVAWQNVAYNLPPHLGYYLPDRFYTHYVLESGAWEQTVNLGDSIETTVLYYKNCAIPSLYKCVSPDGSESTSMIDGFKLSRSILNKKLTFSGIPSEVGTYEFIIESGANVVDGTTQTDTLRVYCISSSGINDVTADNNWVELSGGNLSAGYLTLTFNLSGTENVDISIYNTSGAEVYDFDYCAGNSAPLTISGLTLTAGVYVLRVHSSQGMFTRKMIKR